MPKRISSKKTFECDIYAVANLKKIQKLEESSKKNLEKLKKEQDKTKSAMLNIMEDLEEAKTQLEIDKAKDDAMLASIGEGLIAINNNRRVMIVNRAAEVILGWNMEEMHDKEITNLPLEDETGHPIPLDKRPTFLALSTGETTNTNYFFVKKDKTRFPIAINVTPIKLENKIIGAIIICRDITRELDIDRAKTEFVSLASHQLRTPLGIIKWYIEVLEKDEYFDSAPVIVKQYLSEIYKSNERVLNLVRELLSVSRIEQGKVKNSPQKIDIIQEIKGIVGQLQIIAHKKKVILNLNVHKQKSLVMNIDILRFHEVIENLICNGIEYSNTSGTVNVNVNVTGDSVLISVKDMGIGISEKDQKKLFTKFFRSEKAIDHNPEGTGLGLYLVKSYVEGWGGKISIKSEEKEGSTFTISLPVYQGNGV
jgi:PAS domain S-box-containing protein